jgi:hypothetical protein
MVKFNLQETNKNETERRAQRAPLIENVQTAKIPHPKPTIGALDPPIGTLKDHMLRCSI